MSRISEIMRDRRCSYTEAKRLADRESTGLTLLEIDVQCAVNDSCACGGKGPDDNCCPACEVWHRLHGWERKLINASNIKKSELTDGK